MDKETESDRFGRLAKEDPELVYKAIGTSDEPWWGFEILSQIRIGLHRDDKRIRDLIQIHSQQLVDYVRTQSDPWTIIWCMKNYVWYLEQAEMIEAIAIAVMKSKTPWQVVDSIKDNRTIMNKHSLRDAFVYAIQKNEYPAQVISFLRDYTDLLTEPNTVDVITDVIKKSEVFWWTISEVLGIHALAEQQIIKDAIDSRLDDLIEVFGRHSNNWQIIPMFIHLDDFMQEPKVVAAVVQGIQNTENIYKLLHNIWTSSPLMNLEIVQEAIATRLENAPLDKLVSLMGSLKYRRVLVESNLIRRAIEKRIDSIAISVLDNETPIILLEYIGMLRFLMDEPRILKAIQTRIPDIVQDIRSGNTTVFTVWEFIENTVWINDIFRNEAIRNALVSSLIKDDTYGTYTSKLGPYKNLLHDPIIQETIIREMNSFSNPSWFLCALLDIPGILDNKDILPAVEKLVPLIVQMMDDDEDSDDLILEISETKILMDFEEIKTAVSKKISSIPIPWKIIAGLPDDLLNQDFVQEIIKNNISDLSRAIWSDNEGTPDWFLTGIFRLKVVNDSDEVQKVLDRYLETLITEIENSWDIWYTIAWMDTIPYYLENPRVQAALQKRIADIANGIRLRSDYWYIINEVSKIESLLFNEVIFNAIVYQFRTCYNPWAFLEIDKLDLLLKENVIRDALQERIPDIVFGITHTTDAPFILEEIDKVDFLRNDTRISKAIMEFRAIVD